jgi:benzoyl-CoA reductase/2-hydroxyglutaryl-CoA dehydratase subunit BcrC/BadD/HgdB
MSGNKEYKPYNQLLNEIDKLKDPNFTDGREEIIADLVDLIYDSYNVLGLDTIVTDDPTGYKWVTLKVENNIIDGAVYTDFKEMNRHLGTSDSTIKRKLKASNGLGRIKVNGYTIVKMPYYKSKRGY